MTTPSDKAVLNAIFNPLLPGAEGTEEYDGKGCVLNFILNDFEEL